MENNLFAITSSVNYVNQALEEAREVDKELKVLQNYNNGVMLVSTSMAPDRFNGALVNKKPIFIRHISCFDSSIEINGSSSPSEIAKVTESYRDKIQKGSKVAVQIRKARGEYSFSPLEIKVEIDKLLAEAGAQAEIKNPEYIISGLLDENIFYAGISTSEMNLSSWSGGMVHYKKDEKNDISRAMFKLMEAINVFNIDMEKVNNALDLGAAPGGWTSVLLAHNVAVTAVDTGDMDPRLNKYNNYRFIKSNAAELELPEENFDMLTSDISWNAKNTAALVNRASEFLKSGGYAVVTVKLMGSKVRRTIREVKEIYQEVFDIKAAKQLFHNRDEITLLMRKR